MNPFKIIGVILGLFIHQLTCAQYCTPSSDCGSGDYIENFTFNTISNLSSGGSDCNSDSYINTGLTTTVHHGSTYLLSVQAGSTRDQGFGVWIDYNQDFDFNDNGEYVFDSQTASTSLYTTNITIPSSAATGTTRLRVRSRRNDTFSWWQSCSNINRGESEDYTLEILQTLPPSANFTSGNTISCTSTVNFTDLSTNNPTFWLWDFGDGNTSNLEDPTHTYSSDGLYTITLIVSNLFGSDTMTVTDYIQVSTSGANNPIPASCTPSTVNYCCGFGIIQVTLNTLNSTTADGIAGYEDLTCVSATNLTEAQSYTMTVDVSGGSPGTQNVRAWMDFNNDGVLDNNSELILSSDNVLSTSGNISIPTGSALNIPLRLRVAADYDFEPFPTPCSNLIRGQAEDYTVTIIPNTSPPIANFMADPSFSCTGIVSFTDLSDNAPNYWSWDFGDGSATNVQNPIHTYSSSGIFTVMLYVANGFGGDTITYTDMITVDLSAGPSPASCSPSTLGNCCGYGIFNVSFNTINKSSDGGEDGFQDYSCSDQTHVIAGNAYVLNITTGTNNPQDTRVWIDYNNDAIFDDATERILTIDDDYNPSGVIAIPTNSVQEVPLRMRVLSDFSGSLPDPCTNAWYGQAEDYSVVIGVPPIAQFSASDSMLCMGTCINFNDLSSGNPTGWIWSFPGGSPSSSIDQHPTVCFPNPGNYNISLTCFNPFGSDIETLGGIITVVSCPPPVAALTSSDTLLCNNDCISFTDLTTNNPMDWKWSFPGGIPASSTAQNPANICYSTPGSYDVTLIVSNANGTDTIALPNHIVVNSCIPTALFTASDSNICETACIDFTDQSTVNPTSWNWYFPGASPDTSTLPNPTGICYSTPGTYDVQLITYNNSGIDTLLAIGLINVTSCPPPTAAFSTADTVLCVNGCIDFTDESVGANTWEWTFTGASPLSSNNQHPSGICYTDIPGIYLVKLVVANASGVDSTSTTITVTDIDAGFISPDTLFLNAGHTFADTSTDNPISWQWNFGDGNTSPHQNPTHSYMDTGLFTISLIVENSAGCTDTTEHTVQVVSGVNIALQSSHPDMVIHPNPSDGKTTLTFSNQNTLAPIEIMVYNHLGQVVYTQSNLRRGDTVFTMDLNHVPPGIYWVSIRGNTFQSNMKLTIY